MAEQILVNLKEALAAADGGFDSPMARYNGGWCKTVTALDKSKDNGYSLVGDFVRKESVMAYQEPGLYLDCDIGGSRKNQVKYYTLFALKEDGTVEVLETLSVRAGRTSDWAVRLWPTIDEYFARKAEEQAAPLPSIDEQLTAAGVDKAEMFDALVADGRIIWSDVETGLANIVRARSETAAKAA